MSNRRDFPATIGAATVGAESWPGATPVRGLTTVDAGLADIAQVGFKGDQLRAKAMARFKDGPAELVTLLAPAPPRVRLFFQQTTC